MKRLMMTVLACCMLVPMAACTTLGDSSPRETAQRTTLDEKAAIGVELAYQTAAELVLAVNKIRPLSPAVRERIQLADARAYGFVVAVRRAYDAGNAEAYDQAVTTAFDAIREFVATTK